MTAAATGPIDPALLPPQVRNGSDEEKRLYGAALGFERLLLGELLRSMHETASGDEEEPADAAGGAYRQLVPETLADALTARGGLGLAPELYRALDGAAR